jgi:SAM-dependent methyltransferase
MTDGEPLLEDRTELSLPTPAASPERLALGSWIHGGPRRSEGALRVLEIGCRDGGNLLPLAFYDPAGSYLGLDVDPAAIAAARAGAEEIGLANARFEAIDPLDPPQILGGPFDAILIRDFFARVPAAARLEVLRLCAEQLAEDGLVYLDYPVAPGSTIRALVGEMVRPLAGEGAPLARAERVKAAAAALRGLFTTSDHPYPKLLARELDRVAEASPGDIVREHLDGDRTVFLHREVMELAAAHELRFVCDAGFAGPRGYAPEALRAELEGRGYRGVHLEQTLDVLAFEHARASVLCRAGAPAAEPAGPELLDHLHIASTLVPASKAARLDPGVEEGFVGPLGQRVASTDPLLKAALLALHAAHPRGFTFAELLGRAVGRLHDDGAEGEPSDPQLAGVARDLWALHRRGLVDLALGPPRIPASPGRALHALARFEARTRTTLTTPMHTLLPLSGFDALLVQEMGSAADHDALVGAMLHSLSSGRLALELGGARLSDPVLLEPMARGLVDRGLQMLGQWGLLEGK